MLKLYDYLSSGNGYKVRLLLNLLDIPFERIELDIMSGETRTPDFLAKNPNGKIPVLETEDGEFLPESNAILFYLAEGTPYLPETRLARAQVLRWLFFEQYSHEPAIAVRRSLTIYPARRGQATRELMTKLYRDGKNALGVMETRLAAADWLAGEDFSIADMALYAYTHMAEEGGFDLAGFPGIAAWLARIAALPGHVTINWRSGPA